jgi:peptidoglycan/xylan/chitin deacetylase (PgdA/CDA1 family)
MKRHLNKVVRFLPLAVARIMLPDRIFILCYHAVSSRPLPHIGHLYDIKSPDQFESDLLFLKENCYVASHEELVAHQNGSNRLPAGSVSITFDDGFSECYDVVRPLLLKYRMPCTFFVCTGLVDNRSMMYRNVISLCLDSIGRLTEQDVKTVTASFGRQFGRRLCDRKQLRTWIVSLNYSERHKLDAACEILGLNIEQFLQRENPYMTQAQILALYHDGFTIGSHSRNHPELWLLKWEEAAREIIESCEVVRQLTGQEKVPFAFPFSGVSISRAKLAALRRDHGFLSLFYDTNNLRLEQNFIVNRVAGDTPEGCEVGRSNIPLVMRMAYVLEPLRTIKRMIQHAPR